MQRNMNILSDLQDMFRIIIIHLQLFITEYELYHRNIFRKEQNTFMKVEGLGAQRNFKMRNLLILNRLDRIGWNWTRQDMIA